MQRASFRKKLLNPFLNSFSMLYTNDSLKSLHFVHWNCNLALLQQVCILRYQSYILFFSNVRVGGIVEGEIPFHGNCQNISDGINLHLSQGTYCFRKNHCNYPWILELLLQVLPPQDVPNLIFCKGANCTFVNVEGEPEISIG